MKPSSKTKKAFRGTIFTTIGELIIILAEGENYIIWLYYLQFIRSDLVILQMRVYAIYGRSKWVLVALVFMTIVSVIICVLQTVGYFCKLAFLSILPRY